uniref:Uncharacterized protein n=1 Tax=Aegilops tauschii subsp. strangulata TaxID=200361 RepID=A0A452XFX6_AEGTS
ERYRSGQLKRALCEAEAYAFKGVLVIHYIGSYGMLALGRWCFAKVKEFTTSTWTYGTGISHRHGCLLFLMANNYEFATQCKQ